nr:MAG TPA: hypothetical protein [Caudoviricetes sp.]
MIAVNVSVNIKVIVLIHIVTAFIIIRMFVLIIIIMVDRNMQEVKKKVYEIEIFVSDI